MNIHAALEVLAQPCHMASQAAAREHSPRCMDLVPHGKGQLTGAHCNSIKQLRVTSGMT